MKIALITAQLSIGGAEKMVFRLAQGLHLRGHDVTVIASGGVFGTKLKEIGIVVKEFPLSSKWKWLLPTVWLNFYRFLVLQNFDIVHVHTAPLAFFLRILQHLGGISAKTVLTLHGSPAWKLKTIKFLLKFLALECCAVSPMLANMVDARYIPNAVDIEHGPIKRFESEISNQIREDYKTKLTVGIIARLVHEKGIDQWLKALRILYDEGVKIKTLIAGDGPERDRLEKDSKKCRQEVIFLGFLSDPWEIMDEADVIVIASRREGEPLALLEGMARGKLMLATKVGGIPPLLEGGAGILVEASTTGLVRGVKKYLSLTLTEKEKMISLGRAGITERTWNHCLNQYEKVYSDVHNAHKE